MNVKGWTVCLIEPNKFEGQIMLDLLRNAGVDRVRVCTDQDGAMETLEAYNANVVIASFEMAPMDGAAWTRAYRRNHKLIGRKQAIFITSGAFSRAMAEECRHAGANALIGKPISGKVLLATINKVLTQPREFIDAAGYVGPCRRAGIVTAGEPKKRRKVDTARQTDVSAPALSEIVKALAEAAAQFAGDPRKVDAVQAGLRHVQAYAVNSGDGPLMRVCAAFSLQLASANLRTDAGKAAVAACATGVLELVKLDAKEAKSREAIAESVRQTVGRAAVSHAA